jgi:hypothetical protein
MVFVRTSRQLSAAFRWFEGQFAPGSVSEDMTPTEGDPQ